MATKVILWLVAGYLMGSIPFGLVLSRVFFREDIRRLGSGNIGATNVLRNFGPIPFGLVLALDMGKGAAAVLGGRALGLDPAWALLAGLASIAGHNWSVFLGFKGGKGIATSGGVVLAAYPPQVIAVVLGVFLLGVLATRIMSVGSLSAAASFPLASIVLMWGSRVERWPHMAVAAVAAAFAFYRHRENIRRLLEGREPRITLRRSRPAEGGATWFAGGAGERRAGERNFTGAAKGDGEGERKRAER
jgi:glycerol-3-phosphate acyltransferase PlsY